jgi:hypothetical protein
MTNQPLTCLSCACHRRDGCTAFEAAWPDELLSTCPAACYEPGSDEREPNDNDNQEATWPASTR